MATAAPAIAFKWPAIDRFEKKWAAREAKGHKPSPWMSHYRQLFRDGFVVIPEILTQEETSTVLAEVEKIVSLWPAESETDTIPNCHGMMHHSVFGFSKPQVWLRSHKNVNAAFAGLYGVEPKDLLCSTDAVCYSSPETKSKHRSKSWLHLDQSHKERGARSIQGFVALTPQNLETGCLMVVKCKSENTEAFMDGTEKRDYYKVSNEELDKFYAGCPVVPVVAPAGSLVLWVGDRPHQGYLAGDELPHCFETPSPSDATNMAKRGPRCVSYVSMIPRYYTSIAALDSKTGIWRKTGLKERSAEAKRCKRGIDMRRKYSLFRRGSNHMADRPNVMSIYPSRISKEAHRRVDEFMKRVEAAGLAELPSLFDNESGKRRSAVPDFAKDWPKEQIEQIKRQNGF